MNVVTWRVGGSAVLAMTLVLAACARTGAPARIESCDVQLTVLADGSLHVVERLDARSPGDRPATLERQSRRRRHDGVFDLSVTVDGQRLPARRAPGEVPAGRMDALDLRIPVPGGASAHAVTLDYRVAGAVAVSGIRGRVTWQLLPADRTFAIDVMRVALTLPSGAILLADPWIEEAGWQVARRADGLRAEKHGVSAAESATVGAEFTIDTMAVGEPTWQVFEARTREFIPAFVAAGLFLLVVGAGIIVMVRAQHPRLRGDPAASRASVPASLARAVRRGRPSGFGRARREVVLDLLVAGLADRARVGAARGLGVAGVAVLVSGVAAAFAVRALLSEYGDWPQTVPAALVIDGLLFLVAAARFPILSQSGADAAAQMRTGSSRSGVGPV